MSYWTEVLFDWKGPAPDPRLFEHALLQKINVLGLHDDLHADLIALFAHDRDPSTHVLIPLDGPAIITLIEVVLPLCPPVVLLVQGSGEEPGDLWMRQYQGTRLTATKGAAPPLAEAFAVDCTSGRIDAREIIKLDHKAIRGETLADADTKRRATLLARYPVLNMTGPLTTSTRATPYGTQAPWIKRMPQLLAGAIEGMGLGSPKPLRSIIDLPSVSSDAEVSAWRTCVFDRISDAAQQSISFTFEPQFAGLSIAMHYENRRLCRVGADGEPEIGIDEIARLSAILNLPLELSDSDVPKFMEVHACLFIPRAALPKASRTPLASRERAFQAFQAVREGQVGVKLNCIAYELAFASKSIARTHFEAMQCLDRWGFAVSARLVISAEAVLADRDLLQLSQDREGMEFSVVGGLYRLNYFHLRERLASGPRPLPWAIARPFHLSDG